MLGHTRRIFDTIGEFRHNEARKEPRREATGGAKGSRDGHVRVIMQCPAHGMLTRKQYGNSGTIDIRADTDARPSCCCVSVSVITDCIRGNCLNRDRKDSPADHGRKDGAASRWNAIAAILLLCNAL